MNTDVAALLIDTEAELRQLGLWQSEPPLASEQPFCVDTLSLPQWLQFVFLPRLYLLLERESPLPDRCGIAPMAQEYFRGTGLASAALERALLRIDALLSGGERGGQ